MATPGIEDVPESEHWEQDELSEMMSLLERAEQRMRKSDQACKHTTRAQKWDNLPVLNPGSITEPCITTTHGVARANRTRLLNEKDRQLAARRVEDHVEVEERINKEKSTAGPCWFDMPQTTLSPGVKFDLHLLKLRSALDPQRHYRSESNRPSAPQFSQFGQIIQGPTEYFSSRLPNKERKQTLVEEVLANEQFTSRFKRKYNEIQASKTSGKTSGKKAYYKNLKATKSRGVRKA